MKSTTFVVSLRQSTLKANVRGDNGHVSIELPLLFSLHREKASSKHRAEQTPTLTAHPLHLREEGQEALERELAFLYLPAPGLAVLMRDGLKHPPPRRGGLKETWTEHKGWQSGWHQMARRPAEHRPRKEGRVAPLVLWMAVRAWEPESTQSWNRKEKPHSGSLPSLELEW